MIEVNKKGFTLIELSIVIVIIGLIVAGVMGGQSLVNQAQIRSIITDKNKYTVAVNTFKLEYNALPGDMKNASDYWGSDCDSDADICNGNGDGKIKTNNTTQNLVELHMAWKHLALANLISGSYTGVGSSDGIQDSDVGINAPEGSINKSGWVLGTKGVTIGSECIGRDWYSKCSLLSPIDAKGIDDKIDDGLARSGSVKSWHGDFDGTDCLVTPANTDYNLSVNTPHCYMVFAR